MGSSSIVATWGTEPHERTGAFACDRLIERPDRSLFRGVGVGAPSDLVFRWLCQLRAAPYSYDWIDNLGKRSPRNLTPGLDALAAGQRFMTIFRLDSFEPGRSITLHSYTKIFGRVAVTYTVAPTGAARSRLVAKIAFQAPRGLLGGVMRQLLPAGDLVMMRRQLLTLKALAEQQAAELV